MSRLSQITIDKEKLLKIFSFLYKDTDLVRQGTNLYIMKNNHRVAIVVLNEYNSIINLILQKRYGYLNRYLLTKILGLVYKEEKEN